jgi:hypothetical protein
MRCGKNLNYILKAVALVARYTRGYGGAYDGVWQFEFGSSLGSVAAKIVSHLIYVIMTLHILYFQCYINGKAVPLRETEAFGGRRYSSYSFSTSALVGAEW